MKAMAQIQAEWFALRPFGGFNLIMADPPWKHVAWSAKGFKKSPDAHYETQSFEWIKALPLDALAADDCWLWLWATNNMLPQQLDVMKAWGFDFVTSGHWSKRNPATHKQAMGTGYVLRSAGEPFLLGRRGNRAKIPVTRGVRSVIEARLLRHSQKPAEAFAAAEKLMPGARRIEVFSRTNRPGWASWGDQAGTIPMEGEDGTTERDLGRGGLQGGTEAPGPAEAAAPAMHEVRGERDGSRLV
jgi:N6-adenosine-specific RNA methylase IME4